MTRREFHCGASHVPRREWLPALARVTTATALIFAIPALALLIALVYRRVRQRLARDAVLLLQGLHDDTWWPLALVIGVAVGALVIIHPFPPDDLARDLVANATHFDYQQMFWASSRVPAYDQYIGFDHLAAQTRDLPAAWRALPFQLLPLLGLLGVMSLALCRIFPPRWLNRRLWIAGFVLLTLLMPGLSTRIVQGRPEIWFSVWALSALVLDAGLWFVLGLMLAPLYWLAPVYAAGALLLHPGDQGFPWRAKLAWGAGYALLASLIWWWLSGGHWISGFTELLTSSHDRIGTVSETETVWTLMAVSSAGLWALLAYRYRRGLDWQADLDLLLVLTIFLIPDMVRYTSMVSPLLVLLLARAGLREHRFGEAMARAPVIRGLLTWACIFVLPLGFAGRRAPAAGFLAHVQPGDRVLAPFSPTLYRSLFAAVPRGAVVAPAMEVGMTTPAVQQLSLELAAGTVDCAALRAHHVRWVVESAHQGTPPPCLRLDSTDGPLRAWRVLGDGPKPLTTPTTAHGDSP